MATRFRDFKVSEYWNLAWPFALGIVVGIAGHVAGYRLPPKLGHTVAVLSDAFIVAGLVGLTLELFATRFLIERVAMDVAEKLAGRGLPSQLQALIRDIVDTHIVREDYTKSYRLSEPDGEGYIRLDVTIRYTAKNYFR
jgi:hypothetical protein